MFGDGLLQLRDIARQARARRAEDAIASTGLCPSSFWCGAGGTFFISEDSGIDILVSILCWSSSSGSCN